MDKIERIVSKVRSEGRKALLEPEAKAIFKEYGIPVTNSRVANSAEEAAACAEKIGLPVVLKIVSVDIIHKSDAGGVIINLKSKSSV